MPFSCEEAFFLKLYASGRTVLDGVEYSVVSHASFEEMKIAIGVSSATEIGGSQIASFGSLFSVCTKIVHFHEHLHKRGIHDPLFYLPSLGLHLFHLCCLVAP
jgi:hypothetical protein